LISREIAAPRELVFAALTDGEHIGQWWGPNGFTTTTYEHDVRVGGTWRYTMHGPDGRDYENRIVYTKVEPPARLEYDHFAGEEETPHFQATTTLEQTARGTRVTHRMLLPSAEARAAVAPYAIPGGEQHLARFASYVATLLPQAPMDSDFKVEPRGETEIVITRTLSVPRELVFEAMSQPEHVAQWWGPHGMAMTWVEMDFRAGGSWRFVQRAQDGTHHAFRGEYLEIDPPARFVQTFEYEPWAGHGSTEALELDDLGGGRTRATVVVTFKSRTDRDGMLASGMEGGARQTWDRLEAYALTLA
jgi:uncharacterized protein YndB with AHSA1/START domain